MFLSTNLHSNRYTAEGSDGCLCTSLTVNCTSFYTRSLNEDGMFLNGKYSLKSDVTRNFHFAKNYTYYLFFFFFHSYKVFIVGRYVCRIATRQMCKARHLLQLETFRRSFGHVFFFCFFLVVLFFFFSSYNML